MSQSCPSGQATNEKGLVMGSSVIILVVGIATFFNLVILLWKFQHDRVMDGILDLGALVLIGTVFGGVLLLSL